MLNAPDLTDSDYLVVGLATCYVRQEGETQAVTVQEPVPSAYLEALIQGVPTAYQQIQATTLGAIAPNGVPVLLPTAPEGTQYCADFLDRAIAAARTYKNRESAKSFIPEGTVYTDINYSTEKKRLLNAEHMVTAEDNVKQHAYTHQVL